MSFTVTGLGAIIILIAMSITFCYMIYKVFQWIVTKCNDLQNDPLYIANVEYIEKIRNYIKHEKDIEDVVSFASQVITIYENDYPDIVDKDNIQRIYKILYNLSEIIRK